VDLGALVCVFRVVVLAVLVGVGLWDFVDFYFSVILV